MLLIARRSHNHIARHAIICSTCSISPFFAFPQDSKQFRRATVKSGGDPQQQEEAGGGAENKGSSPHGDRQENEPPETGSHAAEEDPRSVPSVN